MKCIDNELIQMYIDGETDFQETCRVKNHLAGCSRCFRKIEEQRAFAGAVKVEIGRWGSRPVIIPEFVRPVFRKKGVRLKIRHYLYAVSAACAVLLFVITRFEQNVAQESIHLIYSFDGEFNSNRTVSQQEMKFIVMSAEENIVEQN